MAGLLRRRELDARKHLVGFGPLEAHDSEVVVVVVLRQRLEAR